MAFDFGLRHIGIAVGSTETALAQGLGFVSARDGEPDWEEIDRRIKEWDPVQLVVGLPLNMDGTAQPMTRRARRFGRALAGHSGLEVIFRDERLTSQEAKAAIFATGGFRALKRDKGRIDSLSARIILEEYLEEGPVFHPSGEDEHE